MNGGSMKEEGTIWLVVAVAGPLLGLLIWVLT